MIVRTGTSLNRSISRCAHQRGVILVAVLLITLMAGLIAASLLYATSAENSASMASKRGNQAREAAMAGINTAIAIMLAGPIDANIQPDEAGEIDPFKLLIASINNRDLWYDNRDLFRNRIVAEDGNETWYFTIYAPSQTDPDNVRHGFIDESGKIDLNTASPETLLKLPGMTEELVGALVDYRDSDSEPQEVGGAEQDYYDTLTTPYLIKNGPLATVEELLLIKGFNGTIVYGEDANMNGLLEPNEDDGDDSFPSDDNNGELNPGLLGTTTTVARTLEYTPEGTPRVDLNGNMEAIRNVGLPETTVKFIEDYRNDGQRFKHPSQLLNMVHTTSGGEGGRGRRGGGRSKTIRSDVTASDMPLIMENLTVDLGRVARPGLVNVNTAPAEVLAAMDGFDAEIAGQIVSARADLSPEELNSTAWLVTRGIVDEEQYKSIAPRLTDRGLQYRIRCIGFGVPSGRYVILEAVVDFSVKPSPRIVYLRDLSRLGPPFALDPENEEL